MTIWPDMSLRLNYLDDFHIKGALKGAYIFHLFWPSFSAVLGHFISAIYGHYVPAEAVIRAQAEEINMYEIIRK